MARRKAREIAFKLLFEESFGSNTPEEIFEQLFDDTEDQVALSDADRVYIAQIRSFTADHRDEIDGIITQFAKGWVVNRMARVDLALMRLALCEILYMEDIPNAVSINEAVELSKVYSADEGPAYINGVLGAYVRSL